MYPLDAGHLWPFDQWYIAAWADELGEGLLSRRILDMPLVLFRKRDGTPAALSGLCPHRLFPLADAKREGDQIVCGYHGFTFGADGACLRIPGQAVVPPGHRVRVFPLVEKWRWVWIWMGDARKADPSAIPDHAALGLEGGGWRGDPCGLLHLKARYTLLLDNLFDLTHIPHVHARSLPGAADDIATREAVLTEQAGVIRYTRPVPEAGERSLFGQRQLHAGQHARGKHESEYFGPCLTQAGGFNTWVEGDEGRAVRLNFLHGVTPETPATTHYFAAISRNFALDDDAQSEGWRRQNLAVVAEDFALLEKLEPLAAQFGDRSRELGAKTDTGAARIRQALRAQIEAEQVSNARVDRAGRGFS